MARVVQHRSKPPVLLIVFVILFVIATIVAVVGFVQRDDWMTQANDNNAKLDDQADQIKKLKAERNELAFQITGQKGEAAADTVVKKIDLVYDSPEYRAAADIKGEGQASRGGLINDMSVLAQAVKAKQDRIAALDTSIKQLGGQLTNAEDITKQQAAKSKEELSKFVERIEKLDSTLNDKQADTEKAIKDFSDELSTLKDQNRKETRSAEEKLEKVILELQQAKATNGELRRQIEELMQKLLGTDKDTEIGAAGQIYKILPETDVCYINLGSNDEVREGMAFAVYEPDAAKDAKPKANLRAVTVNPRFTECKIVKVEKDKAVAAGDKIVNLAYNPGRKYEFVVKGDFDLHGDGKATKAAAEEVKHAISLHGGKVADQITVQTDYVVLGIEPAKPLKPAEDAPSSVQRAYEDQMKLYNDYFETKRKAETMRIPVLNTNRFLDLTGYMPEKNPQD